MNYVAVSGGTDSTALALLLWERGEDFEMVFADTGAELPEVYWLLPRLAQQVGKKLHVVSNVSFFQFLNNYGYLLPSHNIRWCTKTLKQIPQDRFYKVNNAETVAVGIRADEPRQLKPGREGLNYVYPLAEAGYDKKDVLKLCTKYDLLNPVYAWRSSVSCFCCFFQRVSDWKGLMKHHPTLFAIAEEWERQSLAQQKGGITWRNGYTLEAMRKMDEQQLKLWPEPEEEPCLICII